MTEFGKQLRTLRHRCTDSKSPHGKLTQEEFGEVVGRELGINGYTGAAVSDWERGKAKIHADDRRLLLVVIKVLHVHGGIKTIQEANRLLKAGNYSDLDPGEAENIFRSEWDGDIHPTTTEEKKIFTPLVKSALGTLLSIPEAELQTMLAKAEEGPAPSWPRLLVILTRRFSDQLSVVQTWKLILWIWAWLLAWVLITPSLRWPFLSREGALVAIVAYACGSMFVPALIGALTNTRDHEFWRAQAEVSALNLRLYTHQGASIGFQLGYFFVFMMGLLTYTLGWQSATWVEFVSAAFLVILGYAGARLVPYNLYAAYERLLLRDGWIFFIFFLLGPAWGYFFLETYDMLLTRSLGIFLVLSSLTILLGLMALRYRQKGTTEVPVHWWVIFWGAILLCQFLLFLLQ